MRLPLRYDPATNSWTPDLAAHPRTVPDWEVPDVHFETYYAQPGNVPRLVLTMRGRPAGP